MSLVPTDINDKDAFPYLLHMATKDRDGRVEIHTNQMSAKDWRIVIDIDKDGFIKWVPNAGGKTPVVVGKVSDPQDRKINLGMTLASS